MSERGGGGGVFPRINTVITKSRIFHQGLCVLMFHQSKIMM